MESSPHRRRRLPLLFLVGVAFPCLALSYLAFRGIRNELALVEQRRQSEHRALAALISDTIAATMARSEDAYSRLIADIAGPAAQEPSSTLESLREQNPLVEEVFHIEGWESVHLPAAHLAFIPDGGLESRSVSRWPPGAAAHFGTGQEREFQGRRYGAAVRSYRLAYDAARDSVLKAEALLAVARVQRKATLFEEALTSYETLFREFDRVRTATDVPAGPTSRLEHASVLSMTGDSLEALAGYLDLYEWLVDGAWKLERAEYDFFAGQVSRSVAELLAALPEVSVAPYREFFSALEARGSQIRERTENLLLFQSTAIAELRTRVDRGSGNSAPTGTRLAFESAGREYLISLLPQRGDQSDVWGLLLDAEYLQSVLRETLERQVDPVTTDWIVKNRDGSVVLARDGPLAGTLTVNATLEGNFPPWLIEFRELPQSPYRRLLASSQSIYFYMFVLIATILVFGLILTVRAVKHELELARLKSDFVSTVSHEFKSPLTSIRQLAEMLQADRVPTEERRQRYYHVLVEQSTRLSSLVTNILDLARIEEWKKELQFDEVDAAELVRELAETTQHRVGHEGFVVEAHVEEPLPLVRANEDAITQAILNLLDNAIHYSSEAKRIEVDATSGDGRVSIAVQDHGVGIPGEEMERVFERFYRGGDPMTRSVKGAGLGLTLVKEIVEAHGGTVHVKSEVGEGSTFTISLPAMTE